MQRIYLPLSSVENTEIMKKTILLLLLILVNLVMVRSQNITILPSSQQLNFLASDYSAEADSWVQNNSGHAVTLRWVRVVESEPAEWATTVCDKNLCYSPETASQVFTLGVDSMSLMKLNVFPNNMDGEGKYQILVYDVSDSANTNAVMNVDAVAEVTGISGIIGEVVSIYPNPAKGVLYMNLDGSKHITSVDIHNIVGQKVKTVNFEEGVKSVAIPVADLKKGIYFLRIFSNGKEIATKTFSKD